MGKTATPPLALCQQCNKKHEDHNSAITNSVYVLFEVVLVQSYIQVMPWKGFHTSTELNDARD